MKLMLPDLPSHQHQMHTVTVSKQIDLVFIYLVFIQVMKTLNFMSWKLRVLKHLYLMHWWIVFNPHRWFYTELPVNLALMKKILEHGLYMVLHDILTQKWNIIFSLPQQFWLWNLVKENPSSGQIFNLCVLSTLLCWKDRGIGLY